MNKKRLIWIAVGLVLIGSIFLARCGPGPQNSANAIEDKTVTAFIGDLSERVTASGQVLPQHEAALSAAAPGRVEAVNVRIGDTVQAGDILIQLETTSLELDVAGAEQTLAMAEAGLVDLLKPAEDYEIVSAEAAVAGAQEELDYLLAGPTDAEVALAEAAVNSSIASVYSASADLGTVQNSITEAEIKSAEAAVLSTQLAYEAAQEANEDHTNQATHEAMLETEQAYKDAVATLADLQDGADDNAAQNSLAAASARLEESEIEYGDTLEGATAVSIANAEAQLADAQATLADLLEDPTGAEIQAAEAEVEQARIALADAEERLADASITAPFDGLITNVIVDEGEISTGIVVEMVDTGSLEVVLSVDEVDIGAFTVGQPATYSLEAWPDTEIDSKILTIAPSAESASDGLVSYNVHLTTGDTALPILVGMTANANITIARIEEVLLVFNEAITPDRQAGKYYVNLLQADGSTQEIEVTIGLADDDFTQITGGIVAGDTLVVPGIDTDGDQGPGNGGLFGR